MEYEIRNYSSYDDDPRFVVRSDTGNISNISDRMVRLAAKITEIYAGDIFYDIDTLNRVVESGKNHAWLLCLREDGTCLCALPGFVDSKNEEKTERNAGYLVVSQSGGGMLRQGTRKGIRRTPANRGMRAHRIVKSLDISEDVCHGLCP